MNYTFSPMYRFCAPFFGSNKNVYAVSYVKFTSFNGAELAEQEKLLDHNLNLSLHLLCWNCLRWSPYSKHVSVSSNFLSFLSHNGQGSSAACTEFMFEPLMEEFPKWRFVQQCHADHLIGFCWISVCSLWLVSVLYGCQTWSVTLRGNIVWGCCENIINKCIWKYVNWFGCLCKMFFIKTLPWRWPQEVIETCRRFTAITM